MSEPVEAEIIEAGTDLEVVGAPAPATLFRTDDPAEIVIRATAVANALAPVLKQRNLTKRIGTKDHVLVEGWTFCGSMLGVFAVVEWTRQVEGGWEARAEARTIAGAVVGAAEAECLRSEALWKSRDDYALRSMAQTRAVSKALRAPLGFIVQLAGFEATPAEEMPGTEPAPENARLDPAKAAFPVPKTWPDIEHDVRLADNPDEAYALFQAFLRAATYHLYGQTSLKDITAAERKLMLQKASGAVVWLHDNTPTEGEFLFFYEAQQRKAWKHVTGQDLAIPDYQPPEPPGAEETLRELAEDA